MGTATSADTLAGFSIRTQEILLLLPIMLVSSVFPTTTIIIAQLTFGFFEGLVFELGVLLLLLHLVVVWLLLAHNLRGLLFSFASVLVPFEQVVRAELFPLVGSHH